MDGGIKNILRNNNIVAKWSRRFSVRYKRGRYSRPCHFLHECEAMTRSSIFSGVRREQLRSRNNFRRHWNLCQGEHNINLNLSSVTRMNVITNISIISISSNGKYNIRRQSLLLNTKKFNKLHCNLFTIFLSNNQRKLITERTCSMCQIFEKVIAFCNRDLSKKNWS